ncbi:hypothetical protein [Zhihengliuella flava]|uniref:Uncharacterized protein n=1 Tax=Zhihengliuella flava TaxID=1285193 RepID=A0A931DCE9_9MICC|nr:hypothetical protein [Zhihengliuella flava]MBG6085857.1 hypothetical protein [Zhihengliuella flava]
MSTTFTRLVTRVLDEQYTKHGTDERQRDWNDARRKACYLTRTDINRALWGVVVDAFVDWQELVDDVVVRPADRPDDPQYAQRVEYAEDMFNASLRLIAPFTARAAA